MIFYIIENKWVSNVVCYRKFTLRLALIQIIHIDFFPNFTCSINLNKCKQNSHILLVISYIPYTSVFPNTRFERSNMKTTLSSAIIIMNWYASFSGKRFIVNFSFNFSRFFKISVWKNNSNILKYSNETECYYCLRKVTLKA